MQLRPADDLDWPRIWPFFSLIVAAGETYAYPDGLTPQTARPLWMEAPPGQTVVAVRDGTVLGSAKMGPNRPGRGSHVATASFMVDPAYQRQGVGRALGHFAVRWASAAGYHAMQFNAVVETNHTAVTLWQSLGFQILTTVPEAFDHPHHGLVGLHVMYQRLGPERRSAGRSTSATRTHPTTRPPSGGDQAEQADPSTRGAGRRGAQ